MVSNPNFYGQSTHLTPNQIEDGVDFPHTGIIKALSDGLGQNYAISGFDITVDSATQIDVGAGVIFRDGKKLAVSAVPNLTLSSTYTNGYHLLVANNHATAPVLEIRSPSGYTAAADKVPAYNTGDTIIAVITHNGTTNVGIQYLTVNKTENSLSIGQNTGGSTYTEEGKITAPSGSAGGGIDIVTTTTNSDIRITPNGNGKIVLDNLNWPISDGSAGQYLQTDGSNQLSWDTINLGLKQDAISGATLTGVTVEGVDKVLIQDDSDGNNLKTVTAQSVANLYSETDTLALVTNRGNTTSNNITCADITATGALLGDTVTATTSLTTNGLLYKRPEVLDNAAVPPHTGPISGTSSVIYINDIAAPSPIPNTVLLPDPNAVANAIFTLTNLGAPTVTIAAVTGHPIDIGSSNHRLISTPNQIDLPTGDAITVQAIADGLPPLVTGYYTISH